MKVIIIGGVAGGASCAARLRRLDEKAEIIMVERGPYISYANCGLPYHVGGVIEKESSLILMDEKFLKALFTIDVRTRCEAIEISPDEKTLKLKNLTTGKVTTESYDKLVLSPGAAPITPRLPGIDLPGVFRVRTVPDVRAIREWIAGHASLPSGMDSYTGFQTEVPAKTAVVVGGGFIGIEMAENLVHLGLNVTLLQRGEKIMPPLDPEMAAYVENHLRKNGVQLELNADVSGFKQTKSGSLEVLTGSGKTYPADIVILGIGVRPENWLAKNAGLEIGECGGIRVDDHMRTSNPDIFAVGDAIEVKDCITGQWSLVALAGPANRQGRIAADVIAGRDSHYRGTQGTAIIGLFGAAAAWTGVSEKTLNRMGNTDYEKIYLYPNSHAGYYPGAKYLAMKIIFRKSDGRLLGAQVVGHEGVDKRVDAFAMAIQMGATVYDLEETELCYAPQFGSAKSPVNFAGMVAADVLRGDMPVKHWGTIKNEFLLDVRNPEELNVESVPGAVNIPLPALRDRLKELPHDREILVICRSSHRAYYATRILLQNGFNARNISGGLLSRSY
jgi:NADPH-dependent 2,4-dienoyl-CoA reductase/sulfur reductase-like enzyme/rhodanese-related sulfurtransferase